MINTMRANINLRPRTDVPYDIWCPMSLGVKPSSAFHINSVEKDCLELFQNIDKSEKLEIYNNGEPPAWAERIANILIKNGYQNVSVHLGNDTTYLNKHRKLFSDVRKPYHVQPIGDLKNKIENFFEFYKTKKWNIEHPKDGMMGHYHRGVMLWTQIQPNDEPLSSANPELMSEMKKLIEPTLELIRELLDSHDIQLNDLEKKITLRALEYVNENNINGKLNSHIDSSLLTGLLYHDEPSLHILEFSSDVLTKDHSKMIDISDRVSNGDCFWIPGFVYADIMKSYVSPCWHGVSIPKGVKKRLSMVVRIEDDLMHKGSQIELPDHYWHSESKSWVKKSN